MHDAQRLGDAFQQLKQGRAREALEMARAVLRSNARSLPAAHLTALCHQALGEPQAAVASYRRAMQLAPSNDALVLEMGLAMLEAQDPAAGSVLRDAVRRNPTSTRAWHALGSACREHGDLHSAANAFEQALRLDPQSGPLWINRGVIHRLMGDANAALSCYAAARRAGFSGPELSDAEASAWLDLGEPARALSLTRELAAWHPAYVPGHLLLAKLLWEHGARLAPADDARAILRAAAAAQPGHLALGRACIDFLQRSGDKSGALEALRVMRRAADAPELAVMEAQLLDELGDGDGAARLFAQLDGTVREGPALLLARVRHQLRRGDPGAAAAAAGRVLAASPVNQEALAWLGVAWRLLGDPREEWLCGYDALIADITIDPPEGFADERAFLDAFESSLLPLHTATHAPMDQSLRQGSQTSGPLLGRADRLIATARAAFATAMHRYIDALPDDAAHPFLARKSAQVRFAGSWSARLRSTGRHVNHVHPQGWISSVFYVSLPPSIQRAADDDWSGCLQFGEPPMEMGLHLGARRTIRPRPGHLVLFPSYLWHGTLPFTDHQARLTVAFDAVPVAA